MSDQRAGTFEFLCPRCGRQVSADVQEIGTQVQCPRCAQDFVVPARWDTFEFDCPQCRKAVSATQDQVAGMGECPHCRRIVTIPAPFLPESSVVVGQQGVRTFNFLCKRCGSVLEGRSDQAGRPGKCPTCAAVFTIPRVDVRTGLATGPGDPGEDGQDPTPMHAYAAAGARAPQIVEAESGGLMILCPRCDGASPVDSHNCPACGLPFTMEGATHRAASPGSDGFAVASMVLGIIGVLGGLCIVGAVAAILAIIFGAVGLRNIRDSGGSKSGRGMAIAGIVCGVVGLLVSAFALAKHL